MSGRVCQSVCIRAIRTRLGFEMQSAALDVDALTTKLSG